MAYSVISYETDYIAGDIDGGGSTTDITVPGDCTCIVIQHSGYCTGNMALATDVDLDADAFTRVATANKWQYQSYTVCVLMDPATGAGTITWDTDGAGGGALQENRFVIIYLKGVDTTQSSFQSDADASGTGTSHAMSVTSDESDSIVLGHVASYYWSGSGAYSAITDTEIGIWNLTASEETCLASAYQTGSGGSDTITGTWSPSREWGGTIIEIDASTATDKEAAGSTQNVAVTVTAGTGALQTEKEAAGSTQNIAVTVTQGAGALGTELEPAGSTQEVAVTVTQGTAETDGGDQEAAGSTQEIAVTVTAGTGTLGTELEPAGSTQEVAVTVTQGTGTLGTEGEGDGSVIAIAVTVLQGDAENVPSGGAGNWSISRGLHQEDGIM